MNRTVAVPSLRSPERIGSTAPVRSASDLAALDGDHATQYEDGFLSGSKIAEADLTRGQGTITEAHFRSPRKGAKRSRE